MKPFHIVIALTLFLFLTPSECYSDFLERSYCFTYNYCLEFLGKTLSFIHKDHQLLLSHSNPSSYDYTQIILNQNNRIEKMIDIIMFMNVNTPTINELQETMTKENIDQNSILHLKRLTLLHKLLRSIVDLRELNDKSEEKVNHVMETLEQLNICCGNVQLSTNLVLLKPKKVEVKPRESVKVKTMDINDIFQKIIN